MDLHSAADTPLIESEQIESLLDAAGVDGVKDILEAFWRSTDQLSADIARYVETAACADAAKAAHALKGSAANVGANRLADAARRVETFSKNGDLAGVKNAVDRLAVIYRETRAALDRLLSERA